MRSLTFHGLPGSRHSPSDLDWFREEALRVVLWVLPVSAIPIAGVYMGVADFRHVPISDDVLILPAVVLLAYLGHRLIEYSVRLSGLVTVLGLLLIITAAHWLRPEGMAETLYCGVVLLAAACLGQMASVITAVSASALIATIGLLPASASAWEMALISILLIGIATLMGIMITRPMYIAFEWVWQSYDEARRIATELREHQAELSRTMKSLNEANSRLEHANQELARARLEAEESRRLKAEFAANVSHELRTPLNLIIGFSETMATSPEAYGGEVLAKAYRSDLDAIQRNARHLSNLIDDVLDLSQVEAGRMALMKERVRLGEVVAEAVESVSRLFDAKGLGLSASIPEDLPLIFVDRTRIRQVLINLLGNAVRFTDRGGVTIGAQVVGNDIQVNVTDTGIGISAEDIPKIFEEFRQLDGSIRRRAGGSGLGLAISKRFVELHGGSMWAESQVGTGTTFRFTLPVSSNVIAVSADAHRRLRDREAAARGASPPTIEVVSSDPSMTRLFQRYLDEFRVTGTSGPATPKAAPKNRDGVGADAYVVVARHEEDPASLARDSEARAEGKPVIICTFPSRRDIARELGVHAHLVKPITRDQITEIVDRLRPAPRSVLVVDDDPDMLRLLGRWMRARSRQTRVSLAGGGDEAIAILRSRKPDLVLLDLVMPVVDGYSVLRQIQSDPRLREVPIVTISAHGGAEHPILASTITISRHDGFPVRQLTGCLRASLRILLNEPGGSKESVERRQ